MKHINIAKLAFTDMQEDFNKLQSELNTNLSKDVYVYGISRTYTKEQRQLNNELGLHKINKQNYEKQRNSNQRIS